MTQSAIGWRAEPPHASQSGARRREAEVDRVRQPPAVSSQPLMKGSTMALVDEALNTVLANAVAAGDAPYLVGAVGTSAGTVWSGAAGSDPAEPVTTNTIFRIMSMSNAVGATAAAILAERGELDWDASVVSILPAFDQVQVLFGFDNDEPLLRAPRTPVTLRHLATHTAGFAYELWNESVARFLSITSTPPMLSGRLEALRCPLIADPGTRWQYGPGVDWLGLVVTAIDGRPVDRFCQEEILSPLGMCDTVFELRPAQQDRVGITWSRSPDGDLVPADVDIGPPSHPQFYGMGHALYSTVSDYLRFLRMWLAGGVLDSVRILQPETVSDFLRNQTADIELPVYRTVAPAAAMDLAVLPGVAKSHSLGFVRTETSLPGRRGEGSQFWGGVLNTHFWCDPHADLAGVLMTQLLPFMDSRFMAAFESFERTVYSAIVVPMSSAPLDPGHRQSSLWPPIAELEFEVGKVARCVPESAGAAGQRIDDAGNARLLRLRGSRGSRPTLRFLNDLAWIAERVSTALVIVTPSLGSKRLESSLGRNTNTLGTRFDVSL